MHSLKCNKFSFKRPDFIDHSHTISIRRWLVGNLQTRLRGLCPPFPWDAWGNPRKLQRWRCFWRRMTPVSSPESNWSLTAAESKSNQKGGGLFWRDCPRVKFEIGESDGIRTRDLHDR